MHGILMKLSIRIHDFHVPNFLYFLIIIHICYNSMKQKNIYMCVKNNVKKFY